jgi:hypothetical protein
MEKLRMFYYHAVIRFQKREWWSNQDYDELLRSLVIPYISSQVRLVDRPYGKVVLNFHIANFLSVFRTDYKLPEGFEKAWGEWSESEFRENDYTEQIIKEALKIKWAAKTKSPLELGFLPTKRQVFIIMKFGDKVLDSAYEGVIKPTVRKFKYSPLRIDEVQDGGRITDQMIEEIARSEIVLTDLTGERPNCYYEAGFAHAIGKEMIFTIKRGATIHFDLAAYRFIEWETEDELRRELSKRFNLIKQRATQT